MSGKPSWATIFFHGSPFRKIHLQEPVVAHRRHLFLPRIEIDRGSGSPLHRQISAQLSDAIHAGAADGARLPSSRVLARLLGVSRNTVLTAYEELAADGLIDGRQGASTLVSPQRSAGPRDLPGLLRDAQFPARTLEIAGPDGTMLYLNFSP
jgi:DNA-binding transcriptional regulator YhcF (GntR family)